SRTCLIMRESAGIAGLAAPFLLAEEADPPLRLVALLLAGVRWLSARPPPLPLRERLLEAGRDSACTLLEPRPPAALLTREDLPDSTPGTRRSTFCCTFFCPLPAILSSSFRQKTHKDTPYDSAGVRECARGNFILSRLCRLQGFSDLMNRQKRRDCAVWPD